MGIGVETQIDIETAREKDRAIQSKGGLLFRFGA